MKSNVSKCYLGAYEGMSTDGVSGILILDPEL
jgi:hypothetical protein